MNTCLLFSLVISTLVVTTSSTKCNKDDQSALSKIKSDLGNPAILTTWFQTPDCCGGDWHGIECDKSGRVITLAILGNNLVSQIPDSIGELPYLNELILRKMPNLTGPVPFGVTKLKKLTSLTLDWNSLSGPVPGFLSQLTMLSYLNLGFNKFTGTIPSVLGNLPLSYIRIDRNQLTGTVPESLNGSQLEYLYLSNNNLDGAIPKSFSNVSIQVLDLSHNRLTGDASGLFGEGKPIEFLYLSRNLFEFNLTNVKLPDGMTQLDISHNKVYGRIPVEFTQRLWQNLNMSYNRLCGEIPIGGRLGEFDQYSYFHNKCLCGPPLPPCM